MQLHVAVVGAGLSGLSAALELAASARVTIVDRLPATGGATGWEDASVRRLTADCQRAGVEPLLGATALRWEGRRLLVASPGRIRWLPFDHVVVATGCRPATRAELQLAGSRAAGVYSALVAIHLLEAGAMLGRRAALVGVNRWAERAAHHLHAQGANVAVVSRIDESRPTYADAWWPGWEATEVTGHPRITHLSVQHRAARLTVACDAVVLAADPRPLRNIDGALDEGDGATFIQEWAAETATRVARSAAIARELAMTLKGATA
jgi:NADPH-dependent 2,4-dienoyl-CoA reductase/sulfur reductase-like enzyme